MTALENNKEQPVISIVTIVYNDFENIEKTIKSILSQSYNNVQYIIVDGASTDGTKEIIEKYKDSVDVFLSERDSGISDAFNKGTQLAKGEYINYMNSGDTFIDNDSLSFFVDKIVNTQADVVTAFSRFVDSKIPKTTLSNCSHISKKAMISHQASFISMSLFEKYGLYDEDFKVRMDYEFWIRVLPKSSLYFIDEILVDYSDGGVSGQSSNINYREEIRAQIKNLKSITLLFCLFKSTIKFVAKKIFKK